MPAWISAKLYFHHNLQQKKSKSHLFVFKYLCVLILKSIKLLVLIVDSGVSFVIKTWIINLQSDYQLNEAITEQNLKASFSYSVSEWNVFRIFILQMVPWDSITLSGVPVGPCVCSIRHATQMLSNGLHCLRVKGENVERAPNSNMNILKSQFGGNYSQDDAKEMPVCPGMCSSASSSGVGGNKV